MKSTEKDHYTPPLVQLISIPMQASLLATLSYPSYIDADFADFEDLQDHDDWGS